jgi:hypothetical protein
MSQYLPSSLKCSVSIVEFSMVKLSQNCCNWISVGIRPEAGIQKFSIFFSNQQLILSVKTAYYVIIECEVNRTPDFSFSSAKRPHRRKENHIFRCGDFTYRISCRISIIHVNYVIWNCIKPRCSWFSWSPKKSSVIRFLLSKYERLGLKRVVSLWTKCAHEMFILD